MVKRDTSTPRQGIPTKLRLKAEDVLKAGGPETDTLPRSPEEARRLAHELHVHQIELEMQNEELRAHQLELQAAHDRYVSLYEFAPVGYCTLDEKGLVIEANLVAAQLFGFERKFLMGHAFARLVEPESQAAYFQFKKDVLASTTKQTAVLGLAKTSRAPFIAHVEGVLFEDAQRHAAVIHLSLSDITVLANAQKLLRENKEKYRTLIGNVPVVTWTRDKQGAVTFISPNVAAVCGFSPEEVIGTDMRFWKKQLHPDDAPLVIHSFMQMLSRGETMDVEYRFRRKDGQWIWLLSRALRRSEEHNAVRVDGILIDVTARRQAEEVAQELQRKQTSLEKQAALGQIAAVVAHEINNPLAGIQNAFLMLKKAVPADHPNLIFATMIDREIRRMAEINRQMMLLNRPAGDVVASDAVAAVKESVLVLSSDSRAQGIGWNISNSLAELRVRMHDGELRQVIYNIAINAIHVSQPGEEIAIALERNGEMAQISITDHGPGIAEDILPHIFEPFFSTARREEEYGMGLGLSVSLGLVETAGGRIEVQTKVGQGATFTVVLPCADN